MIHPTEEPQADLPLVFLGLFSPGAEGPPGSNFAGRAGDRHDVAVGVCGVGSSSCRRKAPAMPRKTRDHAVAERFGRNLMHVRRREGLFQEELAVRASLHRTEIGKLENGERVPRIDTLIRLAGSMAVPPGELLDGIDWVPVPEAVGAFSFGVRTSPRARKAPPG